MIFLDLFAAFFKIGLFTFGGGYAMLPLIQNEVTSKKWITLTDLINFIAVSESTPGPFAINISTFVGCRRGGIPGAFFATLGVVLPSFVIIIIIARFYETFKSSKIIKGCMSGLKPCVVGLISAAAISVGKTVFFPDGFELNTVKSVCFAVSVCIFALTAFLSFKRVHPIMIICISALLGMISGYAFAL